MVTPFSCTLNPARIVFGPGAVARLPDEIRRQQCRRALVLSTPHQQADADALAQSLGTLAVGVFAEAAMHTPVDVTERALACFEAKGADCVVALGGGSTTGLGKALAYRNGCVQVVVPTTYAGSEVTPILGETKNGLKTTVKGDSILPEVVIYDPELTLGLPVATSVASGLNAMAHSIEGVYAQERNPIASMMAVEGVRALRDSLGPIVANPRDVAARADALYGAWLCGTVLGSVGMSLHHKICHTLGGSFDLSHAETHAVMLPHTVNYNSRAASVELAPIADLFGGQLGPQLWHFAKLLGAPMALRDLGLKETDLDRAVELTTANPYWNPRPLEARAIRELLQRAWEGVQPH